MKTVVIGDIHGRNIWKNIVDKEKDADKVIFIGDYFDSFNISVINQIDNFNDILNYKWSNLSKIELIIGNHDYHYIDNVGEFYSGYSDKYQFIISPIIESCIKENILKYVYVENNTIFSHAGITNTWFNNIIKNLDSLYDEHHLKDVKEDIKNGNLTTAINFINNMLIKFPVLLGFTPGERDDPYGDEVEQSPIWVRPRALIYDQLVNFNQVVGHTQFKSIHSVYKQIEDKKITITFVDSLENNQYLVIEDEINLIKQYENLL